MFRGNRLLSIGWNQSKTHPTQHSIFRWQHAELSALIGTRKLDLARATLYVARVTKQGFVRISRPCDDCQRVLRAAGVRHVMYVGRDGSYHEMSL